MIVTKALPDKQFVDLCVSTTKNNNMGPQSVCSAMVNMNHARLKTNKVRVQLFYSDIHLVYIYVNILEFYILIISEEN